MALSDAPAEIRMTNGEWRKKSEFLKSEAVSQARPRSLWHLDFGILLAFVIRVSSLSNA